MKASKASVSRTVQLKKPNAKRLAKRFGRLRESKKEGSQRGFCLRFLRLFPFFVLGFLTFISSCRLGGMLLRATSNCLVSTRSSGDLDMPDIPPGSDKLKLAYTFALGQADLPQLVDLKCPALVTVADNLHANTMRLKRMMLAPAFIGDLAGRMQRYTDVAEFEITGKVVPTRYAPDEQGEKIFNRMRELMRAETEELMRHIGDTTKLDKIVQDAIEIGGSPAVLLSASDNQKAGFDALFLSYVTTMWTVFETLAGDLWETAINEKPNQLAQLSGYTKRLRKGKQPPLDSSLSSSDRREGKSVKLEFLQYYNWDLTGKMGTVLKSKCDFARLEGIRNAYAEAFSKEADDIDKILLNDALDILSALRNVIVHRGGVADKEYVEKSVYLSGLPLAGIGQPIPIDGRVAAHAIDEVILCCAKLVDAVDVWLANN
jgi:hypothetical protein